MDDLTVADATEALMVFVVTFPKEERGGELMRLIDLLEEVHIGRKTPMPLLLHLVRRRLHRPDEERQTCSGRSYPAFHGTIEWGG
jgi:hypothetical protein